MIKILHVASFIGNIGDNANHQGFYNQLRSKIGNFKITKFEIREVFWGNIFFDYDFATLCNKYDLIVFGGGNFFELWVDHSETGCSININEKVLSKITTPIVFNSLGVDPAQGASKIALKKFRKFLDLCIASDNIILSCRNDGAYKNLITHVGADYASHFFNIYDAGFFVSPKHYFHSELNTRKKNILFQLAGDMLDIRFSDSISEINSDEFTTYMAKVILELSKENHIILCPHIYKDMSIINDVISKLPDKIIRNNISITPLVQNFSGADYIFDLYRQTDLNVATRFHGNVCSLGMERKTLGLVNYKQIEALYDDLDLSELTIDVRKNNFSEILLKKIYYQLTSETFPSRNFFLRKTSSEYLNYLSSIQKLLEK